MADRIGIIGGTFDPIHYGHLFIAEEARVRCNLGRVIFVPAGTPPHKPGDCALSAEIRYEMTILATEDNPRFEVSRMEIDRPGPSYTVDTLAAFRADLGRNTDLFFIMGADSLAEVLTWHEPERLAELCTIVAAVRPGFDLGKARTKLPAEFAAQAIFLEAPGLHIAATELRERAARSLPIRYLLPDKVEKYIVENHLYRDEK